MFENGRKVRASWGIHELFLDCTSQRMRMDHTFNMQFSDGHTIEDGITYKTLSRDFGKGFEEFLPDGRKTENKTQHDMLIDINRNTFSIFFVYPNLNKFYNRLLEDTIQFNLTEEKVDGILCYKIARKFHYALTKEGFERSQRFIDEENRKIDSLGYPKEMKFTPDEENKKYREDAYWFRKSDYMLIKSTILFKERTEHGLMQNLLEHTFQPTKNPIIPDSTFE
jgi:hypothetical protein